MNTDIKTLTIFLRTYGTLRDHIKNGVQSHGLSLSEFGVLEVLYHKGTLTVAAVVAKVLIANSSMTYVIEQLCEKGLILKERDPVDKRVFNLSLTAAGRHFMDEIYPLHHEKVRQVFDRLSAEEEKTLQTLLKNIGKE